LREHVIFDGLYEQIRRNGHTHEPQMLLLKELMDEVIVGGVHQQNGTFRRVQQDCGRIVARVCQGIRHNDYSLTHHIVDALGTAPLSKNMRSVIKVCGSIRILRPLGILFIF
jgi:hypothetical protein